ncbi:hypothetical protein ACFE04_026421 [Oxalis oulophora]
MAVVCSTKSFVGVFALFALIFAIALPSNFKSRQATCLPLRPTLYIKFKFAGTSVDQGIAYVLMLAALVYFMGFLTAIRELMPDSHRLVSHTWDVGLPTDEGAL